VFIFPFHNLYRDIMNNQIHPNGQHIVVFGGTGRTGRHVITQALDNGYYVTAIARNPAAVNTTHPWLTVVKGDILQAASFAEHMQGRHAVISCTGTESGKPTKLYSQGVQNILAAMHQRV